MKERTKNWIPYTSAEKMRFQRIFIRNRNSISKNIKMSTKLKKKARRSLSYPTTSMLGIWTKCMLLHFPCTAAAILLQLKFELEYKYKSNVRHFLTEFCFFGVINYEFDTIPKNALFVSRIVLYYQLMIRTRINCSWFAKSWMKL